MNIGAASKASGVSERMIRHYEKIGLVPAPGRGTSGYRVYSSSDVARLCFAAKARDLGFPIEEIRALLGLWSDNNRSSGEVKQIALRRAQELDAKLRALKAIRKTLLTLAERCNGDQMPDCPIIDELSRLSHPVEADTKSVQSILSGQHRSSRRSTAQRGCAWHR